jgi:CDGSH-type Zn-finger protein
MEKTSVVILDKGPVIVEGNLTITHSNGVSEEKTGKIALCRCGYSKNKPFCDGAHRDCPVTAEL